MSIKTNETDDDVSDDVSGDARKNAFSADEREMEHQNCHTDLLPVDLNDGGELDSKCLTSDGVCHRQTTGFCDRLSVSTVTGSNRLSVSTVTGCANSDLPLASEVDLCNNTESKALISSRNELTDTHAIVGSSETPHRSRTSTPCEAEEKCPRGDCNSTGCRAGTSGCPDITVDAVTNFPRLSPSPSNVLWKLHSFVATVGEATGSGRSADQANQRDAIQKFCESPKLLTANTFHNQTVRYHCDREMYSGIKSGANRPNASCSPSPGGNSQRRLGSHSANCYTSRNTVIDRPCNATQTLSLMGSLKNCFPEQEQPLDLSLRRNDTMDVRNPTDVTPESSSLLHRQSTAPQEYLPLLPYSAMTPNKVLNHARPMHMFRFPPAQVHLARIRHAPVRSNKCHAKSTETNPRRCSVMSPLQGKRQSPSHYKLSVSSSGNRPHREVKDSRLQPSAHSDQHAARKQWSASKPLGAGHRGHSQYQCNCGAAFETLYQQAVHMEATGHSPSRKEPSMTETFEYQKLVRGQDLWLNYGSEQAREILRCMRCQRSFESLSELTLHMIRTKHYEEIVGSSCSSNNNIHSDTAREKQKQNLIVSNEVAPSVSQRHPAVNGTSKTRRVDSMCTEKKEEMDQEPERQKAPCIPKQEVTMDDSGRGDSTKPEVSAATPLPNNWKTDPLCDTVFQTDTKPKALEGQGKEKKGSFDLQLINDKANLKITDDDTPKVIDDVTLKVTDDTTFKVTAAATRQIEDELTDDTILKVTDNATLTITEDAILHVTDINTLKINDDATIKVIDDATLKVTADATIKVTDDVTMKLTDNTTLNVTDTNLMVTGDAALKVTEEATLQVTDDATLKVTDTNLVVTGNAALKETEDATMQVTDGATLNVTDGATLKVTEDPKVLDVETPNVTGVDCDSSSNAELTTQNRNSNNNETNESEILSKTVATTDSVKTDASSDGRSYSDVCSKQNDCVKRKQITSSASGLSFTELEEFKVPTPKKPKRSVAFDAESYSSWFKGTKQPTPDICKKSTQQFHHGSTSDHLPARNSLTASPVATEYPRVRCRRQRKFSGYVSNCSVAVTSSNTLCASPESIPNRFVAEPGKETGASAIDAMQQFIAKSFSSSCEDFSESDPFELKARAEANRERPVVPNSASCTSRASFERWIYGACSKRGKESYQQHDSGGWRSEQLIDTSSALKGNNKHQFNREFHRGRNSELIVSDGVSKSNQVKLRTKRSHEIIQPNSDDYRSSKSEADDQMKPISVRTTLQDSGRANSAVQLPEIREAAKIENSEGSLQTELMSRDDERFKEFEDDIYNDRFLSNSAPPSIGSATSDSCLDTFTPEQSTAYKQDVKKTGDGCLNLVYQGAGFQDIDDVSSPCSVNFPNRNKYLNPRCKLQTPESLQVQNKRKITRTSDTSSQDFRENLRPIRAAHNRDQSSSIKDLIKTSPYVYLPLDHSSIFTKYTSPWANKEARTSNKWRSHSPSQSRSQTSFETETLHAVSPKSESPNEKQTLGPNSTDENEGR